MTEEEETRILDSEVRGHLDDVLEDDGTPFGGTAFNGETLRDFIEEAMWSYSRIDMAEANARLRECGIKEIKAGN